MTSSRHKTERDRQAQIEEFDPKELKEELYA